MLTDEERLTYAAEELVWLLENHIAHLPQEERADRWASVDESLKTIGQKTN